jgi:hypothetical protein
MGAGEQYVAVEGAHGVNGVVQGQLPLPIPAASTMTCWKRASMTDFALYRFCKVEICGAIGPWNLIGYVLVEGEKPRSGPLSCAFVPAPHIAPIPAHTFLFLTSPSIRRRHLANSQSL